MSTTAGTVFPGRRLQPRVWVMVGLAAACLGAFFATIAFVFEGSNAVTHVAAEFDRSISLWLAQIRDNDGPTGRMVEVSALGSPAVVGVLAIIMALAMVRSKDWLGFAHLAFLLVSASVLSRLLQHIWDRPRPETLLSYLSVTKGSFPSAHLFGAAACYVTLAFLYARYLGGRATELVVHALAGLLVLLIGLSRVYLGAHHTTDVVAGMAGGWAYGLLVAAIFSLRYPDSATPRPSRR